MTIDRPVKILRPEELDALLRGIDRVRDAKAKIHRHGVRKTPDGKEFYDDIVNALIDFGESGPLSRPRAKKLNREGRDSL